MGVFVTDSAVHGGIGYSGSWMAEGYGLVICDIPKTHSIFRMESLHVDWCHIC